MFKYKVTAYCGIAGLMLSILVASAHAAFTITNPATDNTEVSGMVTVTVESDMASLYNVRFSIGASYLFGVARSPPYTATFNSGWLLDGISAVTAIGYDAYGNEIARAIRWVNPNNWQDRTLTSTSDFKSTMSGTFTIDFTETDPYGYCFYLIYIDGMEASYADCKSDEHYTGPGSISFDTTEFTNGDHEIGFTLHTRYLDGGGGDYSYAGYRTSINGMITIQNDNSVIEMLPSYNQIYLAPGESKKITCLARYNDGVTYGSCTGTVTFSTNNNNYGVISLADDGTVTAVAEGYAQVIMKIDDKNTGQAVHITVLSTPSGPPHFRKDGTFSRTYDPDQSMFLVAPFNLEPNYLKTNETFRVEVLKAGVNTLQQGILPNPRDFSKTLDQFKAQYDELWLAGWNYAASQGLKVLAAGDDICRRPSDDGAYMVNWQYGQQAIEYAFSTFASSGAGIGVDMVDEVSSFYGSTPYIQYKVGQEGIFSSISCSGTTCTATWPSHGRSVGKNFVLMNSANAALNTPGGQYWTVATVPDADSLTFTIQSSLNGIFDSQNDPSLELSFFEPKWQCQGSPCDPHIPNDIAKTFADWIHNTNPTVPISWPPLGIGSQTAFANWMGRGQNGISDYVSLYWDSHSFRRSFPWATGARETEFLRSSWYVRSGDMKIDSPVVTLASLMGMWYVKKQSTPIPYYDPPNDEIIAPGTSPRLVSVSMFVSAAMGSSGVRMYKFEDWDLGDRNFAGSDYQSGSNPFNMQPDFWRSMGMAANVLTKPLLPYLYGTLMTSPGLGLYVKTAVRKHSDNSMMFMVTNMLDNKQKIALDLSPYLPATAVSQYRVSPNSIKTAFISDPPNSLTVDFDGAETIAFIFHATTPASKLTTQFRPTLKDGSPKIVLRYVYVYEELMDEQFFGVECSYGCDVMIDRSIGDVYFRYAYLDSNSGITEVTDTQKIAMDNTEYVMGNGVYPNTPDNPNSNSPSFFTQPGTKNTPGSLSQGSVAQIACGVIGLALLMTL